MTEEHLAVRRIKDGTVIDHIEPGKALQVISALGVNGQDGNIVTIAINVPSSKIGKKDMVKVENRFLKPNETNKIAIISPKATVNLIRDYRVVEKRKVNVPESLEGIFRCPNPTCISNSGEPLKSILCVMKKNPSKLRCKYCMRILNTAELASILDI